MTPMDHQPERTTRPVRRLLTRRKAGMILLPAIALTAASIIVFNGSASEDMGPQGGAASVHTRSQEKEPAVLRQNDDVTKQPATTESVHDDGDGSTTQVTVNGESVTVPENGSYHRTTDDGNTRTDIDVDSRQQENTSGNGSSSSASSSVRINVQSNATETSSE